MAVTRATLPDEFYDITSAQMLLQPEPQYLHALLAKVALAKDLSAPSDLGLLPNRATGSEGAAYALSEDGRLVISDPIMAEAVVAVSDLGKTPGHTIRMNRPQFANTTYSQSSREVPAGSSISTTPIDISSEQVAITLKRFGGPYDQTNSRVAPYAVDALDASVSLHKIAGLIGLQAKRDFDRWLDQVMVALFDAASSSVYPGTFAADNDMVTASDAPMDLDTLFRCIKTLDEANIPTFANGRRVAVLHPRQIYQLKNDAQFARYAEWHKDKNPLFPGYIATVGELDVYKSTTLSTSTNGNSVTLYKGQVFGPGMVGLGAANMPKIVPSTDDNYGEQVKVIWLWYAGFVTLDNRFGVSVRTD